MTHFGVLVVVFDVALVVVSTTIEVQCVVVVPFVVVVVGIPLLVLCETMYVTIVVEVSIEVSMPYVVVDRKFVSLGIFGIPIIICFLLLF